jgi:hypothetical protein
MTACLTTASRTWRTEIESQVVAAMKRRELAWIVHLDLETEIASIELDGLVDVGSDISD